ncbi:hypothetical protein XENORESO_012896 [Xenotaenia resolanae]|uniref:Secreted protein n=1 Tax=Xenotaenia resolanae TaxID=208358 RepID=A0ABV0X0V3_9TELE
MEVHEAHSVPCTPSWGLLVKYVVFCWFSCWINDEQKEHIYRTSTANLYRSFYGSQHNEKTDVTVSDYFLFQSVFFLDYTNLNQCKNVNFIVNLKRTAQCHKQNMFLETQTLHLL